MDKKQFTKICPKCGNIYFPVRNFINILAPLPEKCKKCDYKGLFPEIEIDKIEEFKKKISS